MRRYRPSLTEQQINTIIFTLRSAPFDENIQDVLISLVPFEAKITSGIKLPTSTSTSTSIPTSTTSQINSQEEKEKKYKTLYKKWQNKPKKLTQEELEIVQEYRYTHGLMQEEEAIKYEHSLFSSSFLFSPYPIDIDSNDEFSEPTKKDEFEL